MDAPRDSADPDAPALAEYSWDEGGEVRIEYQEVFTAMGTNYRARTTAFFWKDKTPKRYEFPLIPGCTKMDMDDRFPLGMGTSHTYLDVGMPVITGGPQQLTIPRGANPGMDGLARRHDGLWNFYLGDQQGTTYLGNFDSLYSVVLTGSNEWPAQIFKDAIYMPPTWTPTNPAFGPTQLVADTPITVTFTPGNPTKKPPDGALNYVAALVVPGYGPVVDCISDNPASGTVTIPADMVNHARALGTSGLMARAYVSHRVQELTDGVTHNRKRIDFIGIWCTVTPWTAQ